jgi:hypothetical protein
MLFPGTREIRYWQDISSARIGSKSWLIPIEEPPGLNGNITFSKDCHCLIFAGESGTAYTRPIPEGKWSTVTNNLGIVRSITADSSRALFASGKKVLFYSTTRNRRENPPPGLQSLTGGNITGIAIDSNNSAWITDYDNGIVQGPYPLDSRTGSAN